MNAENTTTLEAALDQIEKEIRSSGREIAEPTTVTRREATMAAKKIVKKSSKSSASEKPAAKSDAKKPAEKSQGYLLKDLAKDAGVEPTVARKALRAAGLKKDGTWAWDSKKAAEPALAAIKSYLASPKKSKKTKKAKKTEAKPAGKSASAASNVRETVKASVKTGSRAENQPGGTA